MGTPIPPELIIEPVEPGLLCTICWGSGGAFGDGDTPGEIVVNFSGINKGAGWLPGMAVPRDGEFTLPQQPGVPCSFLYDDGVDSVVIQFGVGVTSIAWFEYGQIDFFFLDEGTECRKDFVNMDNDTYKQGTAKVTIPEVTA